MKVNEIFCSIEGEGSRAGKLATFVRLFGCNLKCSYCDTSYSCTGNDFKEMSVLQIMQEVKKYPTKCITLTGGEPLIHECVRDLLDALCEAGYEVNIETNGSIELNDFAAAYAQYPMFFTMDWKTASSGMESRMLHSNLEVLREQDVLKFVVGNMQDMREMMWLLEAKPVKSQVFASPVFGQCNLYRIANFIVKHNLVNVRAQVQLHKLAWKPEKRGV